MPETIGTISAAKLNTTVLPGVTDGSLNPALVKQLSGSDGYPSPSKILVTDMQPVFDYSSKALDVLLALATNRFADQGVALSGAGFLAYFGTLAADGGLGSTGTLFTLANGLMIPVSLDAPDDGEGVLACQVIGRSSDGETVPLGITTGQSLPNFTAYNSYSAGRAEYNGAAIEGVQRTRVDFNIGLQRLRADGARFGTKIIRLTCRPVITITTLDLAVANAIGVGGLRQGDTDTEIYLRRFDAAGTRVAAATQQHIKISIQGNNGLIEPAVVRASQDQIGAADIIITPLFDGTLPIITVAGTSAIG